MEALANLIAAVLVYVPWLVAVFWLSRRFRRDQRGASGALTTLLRVLVFGVLALFVPGFAGLMLLFWAYIASDHLALAGLAHLIAIVPACWLTTRRVHLPLQGGLLKAATVYTFLAFVLWLPPLLFVIPAAIIEGEL
jgi:hypothetical protein